MRVFGWPLWLREHPNEGRGKQRDLEAKPQNSSFRVRVCDSGLKGFFTMLVETHFMSQFPSKHDVVWKKYEKYPASVALCYLARMKRLAGVAVCHRAACLNAAFRLVFTTYWPRLLREDETEQRPQEKQESAWWGVRHDATSSLLLTFHSCKNLNSSLFIGMGTVVSVLLFSKTRTITLAFSRSQSLALYISGLISNDPFWFDMATLSSFLYSQKYLLVTL